MTSRDATTDPVPVDGATADQLYAVVDLLDGNPGLRRALSDHSAPAAARQALARKVLGERISAAALAVVSEVVGNTWSSPRKLVQALETATVRGLLEGARQDGSIAAVQEELHAFAGTLSKERELAEVLREPRYPVERRREMVQRLTSQRYSPVATQLLTRATGGRNRNLGDAIQDLLNQAAQINGQQVARVTVARPLDEQRQDRLRRALEQKVGGPVVLQITVDPAVLGGIDVRVGDHIIESTMAGRLEDARRQLQTH